MRIAICDDEKRICAILAEKVGKICPNAEIMTFASGEKLLGADILPDLVQILNQFKRRNHMKKLKLSLEYQCYPIWSYDEDGSLIDNDLPEELRNDEELDNLLLDIQETFDGLYIDTPSEFTSNDFSSDDEKEAFQSKIDKALNLLID
jgi:hypothetical protein